MVFNLFESSRSRSVPVELYRFDFPDSQQSFFYADGSSAVLYQGNVYKPIPIQRGNIVASGSLDKATVELRIASSAELASIFKLGAPSEVVTVRCVKGSLNDIDADFKPTMSGRVLGCGFEQSETVFNIEPTGTGLRRPGVTRNWQYGCPYALYGDRCRADMGRATFTSTVTAISATGNLQFDQAFVDGSNFTKFLGGLLFWNHRTTGRIQRHTITAYSLGNRTLKASATVTGLAIGDSVTLRWGCNHRSDDCETLHQNILNYGGQLWIPGTNPVGFRNNFY